RIIEVAANKLAMYARATEIGKKSGAEQAEELSFELTDLNGNVVGRVDRVAHGQPVAAPEGGVYLMVDVPSDGLTPENLRAASAQFRGVGARIATAEPVGLVLNDEGVMVGRFVFDGDLRP